MISELSQKPADLGITSSLQAEALLTQRDALVHDDKLRSLIDAVSHQRFGRSAGEYQDFEGLRTTMRGAFDFRSGADGSYGERSEAEDFACDEVMADAIDYTAKKFGLTGDTQPENSDVKVALVLGGAALSPLNRTGYAKELIDQGKLNPEIIALLGSDRPVDVAERARGGDYAVNATTEFELMIAATETVWRTNLNPEDVYELTDPLIADNLPRHARIAHIPADKDHTDIFILSAPMLTDPFEVRNGKPGRRARTNSRDTFNMLARVGNFQVGDRAVAITNAHFRPFQGADAAGQLSVLGVETEIVGYDSKHFGDPAKKPNELLQEMLTAADSLAKAV